MTSNAYVKTAAGLIVAELRKNPVRTVLRADILAAWYVHYPDQVRQVVSGDGAHDRRSRRSYLGQKTTHRGRNTGLKGRQHLQGALVALEHLGVLERTPETVRVTDVQRLVLVANAPLGEIAGMRSAAENGTSGPGA